MTQISLVGPSPFDAIKRTDTTGEYWSARDLMAPMGYGRWNEFRPVLDRAMRSAANQGHELAELFRVTPEKTGGRPREDFHLTRFAAYLVAMNGDPRKTEVAAAQAYFATRTREAEIAEQQFEVPASFAEALELAARQAREIEANHRVIEALEPAATAWDALATASGDYSVREAAQILDRDPQISTGQNRLFSSLRDMGWVDSTGQPYQAAVDAGRLVRRTTSYTHPHTGEPVLSSQVRITPKGIADLRGRLAGGQLTVVDGEA